MHPHPGGGTGVGGGGGGRGGGGRGEAGSFWRLSFINGRQSSSPLPPTHCWLNIVSEAIFISTSYFTHAPRHTRTCEATTHLLSVMRHCPIYSWVHPVIQTNHIVPSRDSKHPPYRFYAADFTDWFAYWGAGKAMCEQIPLSTHTVCCFTVKSVQEIASFVWTLILQICHSDLTVTNASSKWKWEKKYHLFLLYCMC